MGATKTGIGSPQLCSRPSNGRSVHNRRSRCPIGPLGNPDEENSHPFFRVIRRHNRRARQIGTKVLAAGGLKQMGARTLGFQKSGSSVAAPHDRSTIQRKPFVPFTAVLYPFDSSTITSAPSETDAGAALRASAISEFPSGIKY